jgi:hypothetical protein
MGYLPQCPWWLLLVASVLPRMIPNVIFRTTNLWAISIHIWQNKNSMGVSKNSKMWKFLHFMVFAIRPHWGKTAYMGQRILHCRFESNFWEILLQQDTCTVQLLLCVFLETGKEVSKFGTCCVNKVQLLLRRLPPIRVLSIKIKFVCITELYVSRLWQICTALWQHQGGINIVQEFWIQCHVNFFIYNRINKIYLPTTAIFSSLWI